MKRRFLLAAGALAVWAAPAAAQMPQINMMPELKSRSPEEKERDAQIEKAYKESLKKIPNAAPTDPWGNVRGADAAPAKPKAAQPKAAQPKQLKGAIAN